MAWRGFFLLLGLASIASASTWFLWTVQSGLLNQQSQADDSPILIINNLQVTQMNKKGQRAYILVSPYLEQLPKQQGTRLREPAMTVLRDNDRVQWQLEAEYGWLAADNQQLKLQDTVVITRPASSGDKPWRITTRNVLVQAIDETQIVTTKAAVHMEMASGVVDGVGLRGDLSSQQWQLLANVRGRYAPPDL